MRKSFERNLLFVKYSYTKTEGIFDEKTSFFFKGNQLTFIKCFIGGFNWWSTVISSILWGRTILTLSFTPYYCSDIRRLEENKSFWNFNTQIIYLTIASVGNVELRRRELISSKQIKPLLHCIVCWLWVDSWQL